MDIKLIACDMDGTLLTSDKKISQRTRDAIRKAIEAGKIFLIATGRMFISARPYAESLDLDVPLVTYNGALVKGSQSGKVFYEHKMKAETAQEVLKFCKEKGYYLQYYINDDVCVEKGNEFSEYYGRIQNIPIREVGPSLYDMKEAPYKLLVISPLEEAAQVRADFEKHFGDKLDIYNSQPNFLELMEPGINKWMAVKAVAEHYNVSAEEIMCLGDSNNDYDMVANAGIGVAVSNATDKVLNAAKIITAPNDNDGVAMALESILTEQAKEF